MRLISSLLGLAPCFVTSLVVRPPSSFFPRSSSSCLAAVSRTRDALIDGAEWGSLREHLEVGKSSCGRMTVVTGTLLGDSKTRVVGIQTGDDGVEDVVALSPDCSIYQDSMAVIPKNIKDDQAIFTLIASLGPIHCALPKVVGVGGSESDFLTKDARIIVIGGSEYASFVARGLAAMGTSVSIVSTGNPQIDDYRVESLDPAVGEMEVAFCSHVGAFDALVDTISDEANLAESSMIDDDDEFGFRGVSSSYSGVLTLLKSRHKCHRYVSTMTASQRIVRDGGVLFGPGQAKDHIKRISNDKNAPFIIPPKGFGTTVGTLLKDGITYSWKYDGNTIVRAWSLPEFWELASWPRDAAGGSNIRFGFPVVDDLDMLADDDGDNEDDDEELASIPTGGNPFVIGIDGVSTLSREILNSDDKDSVLFLSANYCRTCKVIAPAYIRFARLNQADNLLFAKADTAGKAGKELGRLLEVNAVPLFVFFRKGERFGTPLSINKLPSKKLDLALELLTSGAEWDGTALEKMKEKKQNRSS